ncbi:lipase 1-like [Achroia grisella]|uniref:lipase 1-like n=1 Tax=Achroia grisella TaxID=688607 RepID=UPI0027D2C294|nr:lipase 1-like [Achroia grisella]
MLHMKEYNISRERIREAYIAGMANEDVKLSVGELILKYGHPLERHEVVTEDGYILTMFRIPKKGPVVFLMHGLLGSADDFVIGGPEVSLAYLLANDGYDVWLGNARGNKHSRRHISLNSSEPIFWEFSWHEIGFYDLPAMIDYTLNITNKKSLYYVGHSQGTTSFFVMGSLRPEYNEKIILMIALAPAAYMSHTKSPLVRLLAPISSTINTVLKSLGIHEYLPNSPIVRTLISILCDTEQMAGVLCMYILMMFSGLTSEINITVLPVLIGHVPSGGSINQVLHYVQEVKSGKFRQFDHGNDGNMVKYGRKTPPSYPLEKISVPIYLVYSGNDLLCQQEDIYKLCGKLKNCTDIYRISDEYQFNHLDFVWSKHFKSLVYERILKQLWKFT